MERVYRANLRQTEVGNPIASVLPGSLGELVWTKDDENEPGQFTGTLEGAFPANSKVWGFVGIFINDNTDRMQSGRIYRTSANTVALRIYELATATPADIESSGVPVEIRVYQ